MKKKVTTYLLGIAVVAIWGMIIFRVIQAFSGNDTPQFQNNVSIKKEAFNDYTVPKDTAHLNLNYRDPFSDKKIDTVIASTHKAITQINPIINRPKPQVNWSGIRYIGFVGKIGSKKWIAMMSINGREAMMTEGETTDQVKLIKNMRDSVKVSYQGATKFITMNKNP